MSLQDIDSDLPPLFQTEIDDTELERRRKQDAKDDTKSEGFSHQGNICF